MKTEHVSDAMTEVETKKKDEKAHTNAAKTSSEQNVAKTSSEQEFSSLAALRAIVGATTVVCLIVVGLYWRKGAWTVIMILTYLLALTTMKGAVKMVEKNNTFSYPLFLTGTHFVCGALVSFAMILRNTAASGEKMTAPSMNIFTSRFGPIAFFFAVSVAMGNFALVYSTTAFCEIVGATGPLWCLGLSFLMRQPIDLKLLAPCSLVCIGCALTSNGDPKFSWIGFFFCVGANIPRSMKGIFQQMLLQGGSDATVYSPLDILAWTCVPSSAIMLTWSLLQEGTTPYMQWYSEGAASSLTLAILISCVNACILNLAVLFVVKELGAVGQQIVAQSKSILVVLGGVCFLHEQFSRMECIGFVLVLTGVYLYNDLDTRLKAAKKAEQQALTAEKKAEQQTS